MDNNVINIQSLTKVYKIFKKPSDRVKEALSITKKRYSEDFFALKDVSFTVESGETIGIIGKNGAGKSTLLKILTGVLTPTSGEATINGKVAALLELGAGFNPEMTGLENIYLNGSIMGYSEEEMDKKVDAIIEFADIGDFIHQPVKMYSSGMFARLAFAVNANVEPEILIVDEALAVGDVFFQSKCFKKFSELRKKGTTILFVSHDIGSVKQLCSRVIWLESGTIKMMGNTDEVCDKYFNEEIEKRNANTLLDNKKIESIVFSNERADWSHLNYPLIEIKSGDIISDRVRIVAFMIFDRDYKETHIMNTGYKYNVIIVLDVFDDIDNAILGITMTNRKGIDIIGTNSFSISDGKTFKAKKNSKIKVEFSFVMPGIIPDIYIWDTAIADGTQENHKILSWIHGVKTIEINSEKSNKLGLVSIDCDMKINTNKLD